jgi:hypothetical protein
VVVVDAATQVLDALEQRIALPRVSSPSARAMRRGSPPSSASTR